MVRLRAWAMLLAVAGLIPLPACSSPEAPDPGVSPAPTAENEAMFNESEAYERFMGRWSRRLAPDLVVFAGVGQGHAVLDVGSGTGALAEAVLAAVPSSTVVGIDPAEAYVAQAQLTLGGDRAAFEVGDAQQMRFERHRFDRTLSLLVVNFIPDADRAIDEMVRVTRPGGIVAAAVWDYGSGMEMLRTFWDEAVALDPAVERRDERHMPLCRAGELAAKWREHGLGGVEEAPLVVEMRFESFDDYWAPFLLGQGPAGAYVVSLSPERQQALAARLRARLQPEGEGPITMRARAWAVKGTVPSTAGG